ncbi:MAG: hypothetical protein K2X27_15865 [Candidatus Obscuribacterales bacterium]|nr:hypothetical protein [Candidatus Obscuribacterales bacterium]
MSRKNEDEIENRLKELEIAMKAEEKASNLPALPDESRVLGKQEKSSPQILGSAQDKANLKSDLYLLSGFTSLTLGILVLFSHLRVSSWSVFNWFGAANTNGYLVLSLLVGMGFFFYDYKNKVGWLILVSSLAALIFSLFSRLNIYFPQMSLLGMLLLFVPLALGAGLIARALKMQKSFAEEETEKKLK